MNLLNSPKKLSAISMAGSFFCIILLILFTNPLLNIAYAMFFFLALSIWLISISFYIVFVVKGNISPRMRTKILILAIFLTVLLMFRSAGALGVIDAIVLCAVAAGALFYFGRRA